MLRASVVQRGCSSMAEWQLPKLYMAVRFRSPAFGKKLMTNKKIAFGNDLIQFSKWAIIILFCPKKIANKSIQFFLFSLIISFLVAGCASAPITPVYKPEITSPGVYHQVVKGQTLWRISQIYNIDLDEIARFNRISDAANIETGQLIFIPHGRKPQYIPKAAYSSEEFIWPIKGRVISAFGQTSNNMINKGINIQPSGNPDVVASRSGKVVFYADSLESFGKTIIIDHNDGFSTVYARNQEVFIRAGDKVQKGSLIARAGSAGRDKSTYLHFEVRKKHIPQNPFFYLSH